MIVRAEWFLWAQLGFGLTIDSGLPVAINERHPVSFRDSACIVDVLLIVIAVNGDHDRHHVDQPCSNMPRTRSILLTTPAVLLFAAPCLPCSVIELVSPAALVQRAEVIVVRRSSRARRSGVVRSA
jgi:hypothetical protein